MPDDRLHELNGTGRTRLVLERIGALIASMEAGDSRLVAIEASLTAIGRNQVELNDKLDALKQAADAQGAKFTEVGQNLREIKAATNALVATLNQGRADDAATIADLRAQIEALNTVVTDASARVDAITGEVAAGTATVDAFDAPDAPPA